MIMKSQKGQLLHEKVFSDIVLGSCVASIVGKTEPGADLQLNTNTVRGKD